MMSIPDLATSRLGEFRLEHDFPNEHFGTGDKLRLKMIIERELRKWEKLGQRRNTRTYQFFAGVCIEMYKTFGYETREEYFDFM